jgi:hypothetical protein
VAIPFLSPWGCSGRQQSDFDVISVGTTSSHEWYSLMHVTILSLSSLLSLQLVLNVAVVWGSWRGLWASRMQMHDVVMAWPAFYQMPVNHIGEDGNIPLIDLFYENQDSCLEWDLARNIGRICSYGISVLATFWNVGWETSDGSRHVYIEMLRFTNSLLAPLDKAFLPSWPRLGTFPDCKCSQAKNTRLC